MSVTMRLSDDEPGHPEPTLPVLENGFQKSQILDRRFASKQGHSSVQRM